MKEEALNIVLTARMVLDRAKEYASQESDHAVSMGVMLLQDSVELLLIATCIELRIDEHKDLERLKFHELLSALREAGVNVPNIEAFRALNKERALIKHHGNLASSKNVVKYMNAIQNFSDGPFVDVFGCRIEDVFEEELLEKGALKEGLKRARRALASADYYRACVVTSTAFESLFWGFSVAGWESVNEDADWSVVPSTGSYTRRDRRTKSWIRKHVRDPLEYVQPDFELLESRLIELGINPADFRAVYEMLPKVVYTWEEKPSQLQSNKWYVEKTLKYWQENLQVAPQETNHEKLAATSRYCLDKTVEFARKLQQEASRLALRRNLVKPREMRLICRTKRPTKLYSRASMRSNALKSFPADVTHSVLKIVPSFEDPDFDMVHVYSGMRGRRSLIKGYIPLTDCELGLPELPLSEQQHKTEHSENG